MVVLRALLLMSVFSTACPAVLGQAYPTNNVLFRIAMVESPYGRGTTFSIDVDGREYWITAKHIITGAKHPPYGTADRTRPVSLKILDPSAKEERWLDVPFTVIDSGKDIDIVALAPPKPLLHQPIAAASFGVGSIMLGGDCSFLGFPFGGGWKGKFDQDHYYWVPYVKRCTISSIPGDGVLILDGINNHGFSGGPVLYQTGAQQRIIGVISGYVTEPSEVISTAQSLRTSRPQKAGKAGHVNTNSGFIIAYFLDSVIEAIRKNPSGPLRTAGD